MAQAEDGTMCVECCVNDGKEQRRKEGRMQLSLVAAQRPCTCWLTQPRDLSRPRIGWHSSRHARGERVLLTPAIQISKRCQEVCDSYILVSYQKMADVLASFARATQMSGHVLRVVTLKCYRKTTKGRAPKVL